MARRTFFSFRYKPDVNRTWIVRNFWVTKLAQSSREDDESLMRFLREGMQNTSVTCVLVGRRTTFSRSVRYETFKIRFS